MITYQPVQYSPLRYEPSLRVRSGLHLTLGQQAAAPNVTPGKIKATAAVAGTATLAVAAATVWVGVTTGQTRAGVLGVAGWVVAVTAGIAGLLDLIGTIGVLTMPSSEMQAAIDQGKARQTTAV